MQFNDLLRMAGIDPKQVNVILHSPQHAEFSKVLPTLVHTRRAALDMYQATHNPPAELALKKGRPLAAVFVKVGQGRQVFVGLYDNLGWRSRPWGEILADGGSDPGVTIVDVDLDDVARARARIGAISHVRAFTGP